MLQRTTVVPLAVLLAFTVCGFMTADWSVWVEGFIGIVVFLVLFFTREAPIIGTSWRDPQRWFLILLAGALITSFWSTNAYATLRGYLYIIVAFTFFRAGRAVVAEHSWKVLGGLHVLASGFAGWALVDQIQNHLTRAEGFLGNANALGAYLALALPIGIAVSMRASFKLRIVSWIGVCIVLVALLRTFSLTAFFSLFIGGVIVAMVSVEVRTYVTSHWKKFSLFLVVGLALAIVILGGLRAIEQRSLIEGFRLDKVITAEHFTSSFQQRWRFVETTAAMIADRPFTGFGLGSYQNTYQRFSSTTYELPRYAHNHYFEFAAETGIFVGVLFIVLCILIIRRIYNSLSIVGVSRQKTLIAWAILGSMVAAFVDFGWHFPAVWVGFWYLVGWFTRREENYHPTRMQSAFSGVVLFVGFIVLLRGLGVVAAYTPFQSAEVALSEGQFETAISDYQNGLRFDPNPNMAGRLAVAHWGNARGNIDELTTAQQLVDRILKYNPYDHFAYQLRGRIAFSAKDFAKADVAFARAVELDHGFHLDITTEYANFLLAQGRPQDAYVLITSVLNTISPDAWSVNPTYASDLRALQAYQEQAQASLRATQKD